MTKIYVHNNCSVDALEDYPAGTVFIDAAGEWWQLEGKLWGDKYYAARFLNDSCYKVETAVTFPVTVLMRK